MEAEGWVKVYLFYHPTTGELKGFTGDKTIAKAFQLERPHYKMKKRKMLTEEYQPFQLYNNNKMLFENVLTDGKGKTYTPIMTYSENEQVEYMLSFVQDAIDNIHAYLRTVPLKKKVRKLLEDCISIDLEKETTVIRNFDILKLYLRFIADY